LQSGDEFHEVLVNVYGQDNQFGNDGF